MSFPNCYRCPEDDPSTSDVYVLGKVQKYACECCRSDYHPDIPYTILISSSKVEYSIRTLEVTLFQFRDYVQKVNDGIIDDDHLTFIQEIEREINALRLEFRGYKRSNHLYMFREVNEKRRSIYKKLTESDLFKNYTRDRALDESRVRIKPAVEEETKRDIKTINNRQPQVLPNFYPTAQDSYVGEHKNLSSEVEVSKKIFCNSFQIFQKMKICL